MEKETVKWQQRWEESNTALSRMRINYQKVQEDLGRSKESLDKMKSLCRMLHNENRDLQAELKEEKGGSENTTSELSDAVAETLAGITGSDVVQSPLEVKVFNHEAKKRDAAAAKKVEALELQANEIAAAIAIANASVPNINKPKGDPAPSVETVQVPPVEAQATVVISDVDLADPIIPSVASPKKENPPTSGPDTNLSPSSPVVDSNGNKSDQGVVSPKEESQEEAKGDGESHKGKKKRKKNKK